MTCRSLANSPPLPNPAEIRASHLQNAKKADFCGLLWFLTERNRVKCGCNAVFPQELWYNMRYIAAKISIRLEEVSWLQA
jgi:hypothetical protein